MKYIHANTKALCARALSIFSACAALSSGTLTGCNRDERAASMPATNRLTQNLELPFSEVLLPLPESVNAQWFSPGGMVFQTVSALSPDLLEPEDFLRTDERLYVADTLNHTLRRLSTQTGMATTLAGALGVPGHADGALATARFNRPTGVTLAGAALYVTDTGNHVIRRIDLLTSTVTTFAGQVGRMGGTNGQGSAASFNAPTGIIHIDGVLYVADTGNSTLRTIDLLDGHATVALLAGSPGGHGSTQEPTAALEARFNRPTALAHAAGKLYIADTGNGRIHTLENGQVSPFAGAGVYGSATGPTQDAQFGRPAGLTIANNTLFVSDAAAHAVFAVGPLDATPSVSLVAGGVWQRGAQDGPGSGALFRSPGALASYDGQIFVADQGNHTVRRLHATGNEWRVKTLSGTAGLAGARDGWGVDVELGTPKRMVCDQGKVYTLGGSVLEIEPATGATRNLYSHTMGASDLAVSGDDVYVAWDDQYLLERVALSSLQRVVLRDGTNPDSDDAQIQFRRAIAMQGVLYFTQEIGFGVSLEAMEVPSGVSTSPYPSINAPIQLETNGTHLYWAAPGAEFLQRFSPSGGTETTLVAARAGAFAVDAQHAYFTADTQVVRAQLATGQTTTVEVDAQYGTLGESCVSGTNLMVASTKNGESTLLRVDLTTSPWEIETVALRWAE